MASGTIEYPSFAIRAMWSAISSGVRLRTSGKVVRMTPFEEAIVEVLGSVGRGEVVTYGEVALEAGRPGAARAVGAFLAGSGGTVCWWRVVTSTGRLVPGNEVEQAERLRAEGVVVDDATGRVRRATARSDG
jgi:methylated-DNA-protein-cysteine methyltransferase-like protein